MERGRRVRRGREGRALRRGLAREELFLVYQPIVDLRSGRVRRVEALVRWRDPRRGIVPPDAFLRTAVRADLMPALTHHVLDAALRQCAAWRRVGADLRVAVNVDATDFAHPGLAARTAALLERHAVPGGALQLEITERAVVDESDTTFRTFDALRALDVTLAVDDYGTGFGSLLRLSRMPVSDLKIDRAFTHRLATDRVDAQIVRHTIALGRSLGVAVTVEGVEEPHQWRRALEWGADAVQGFLVGRPMSADDVLGYVRERDVVTTSPRATRARALGRRGAVGCEPA